ncbi:MAG: DUF58 domain-containing protein [Burkholderiales bacterium]|nr:MAG: DUF58 domain-containing protein [Burkholderiales bacterium]
MSKRKAEALLHRLDWTVLRRLDGLLQGQYRTLFRGSGLDLADLREYQPQDDVRHIVWNVTARLQAPHVRLYHEERELSAWFLLDLSASIDFGSTKATKRSVSTEFVTVMARLLTRQGNCVGAMLYGTEVDVIVPARGGRRHVQYILEKILAHRGHAAGQGTLLGDLLDTGARAIRRRSLVFVVSDFISAPGWPDAMSRLARRHEVVAVRLYDPLELALPDLGLVTIEDAETGEQLFVDTGEAGFRSRFLAAAARQETEIRQGLARAGVDTLELSTEDDLAEAVLRYADLRRSYSRRAAQAAARNSVRAGRDLPVA